MLERGKPDGCTCTYATLPVRRGEQQLIAQLRPPLTQSHSGRGRLSYGAVAPRNAIRHRRDGVIARVQAEWDALSVLVRSSRPEDLEAIVFQRESPQMWTAKDVVAHVTEWKREGNRALTKRPRPPYQKNETLRATNARIHAEWRDRPIADVLAEAECVHQAVIEALRALPEDFFSERERSPLWPYDLAGHVAEHGRKHLERVLRPST